MSSTSTSFPCVLESAQSQGAFQAHFTGLRAWGPGAVGALPAPDASQHLSGVFHVLVMSVALTLGLTQNPCDA